MKMSQLFSQTLRKAPADAEMASHQLLVRAGFIRQLAAGIFTLMPLGKRAIDNIAHILRREIEAIGGQEISMPVVHPGALWKETGRWYQIDAELSRFKDRTERDMVLGMTHEEVVTDLVRKEIQSYRQLPCLVYQIQTKWRDDPRPRAGLIRVREFLMKDSYSLDADEEGLDQQYWRHHQAYFNIFNRCALPVISVQADVGMMGGKLAHEFIYLTPIGEDTLLLCDGCGYRANRQNATFAKTAAAPEELLPLEKVATPNAATIEELTRCLNVPAAKTAKAVFVVATLNEEGQDVEKFVLATVRGDQELNETKLANALGAKALRPAREEEIRAAGIVPGYGSALGVKGVCVVADDSIAASANLVAGANEAGYHVQNVNLGRDFEADIVCDLAAAREGDACSNCGQPLGVRRGVEVGNIFKLGTRYTEALGATFLDEEGQRKPVIMGSYGIGLGRLLACIAEEYHDDNGLVWPLSVAPYSVHLISLALDNDDLARQATELYEALQREGVETLFDERNERPGVKFKDADLIGLPLRLTLSKRSLEAGGVEFKRRADGEQTVVPVEQVVAEVRAELERLSQEIEARVVEVARDA